MKRTQDGQNDSRGRDRSRGDAPPKKKFKKESRKPEKGESTSSSPSTHFLAHTTDFASSYASGSFSDTAISLVEEAGLSLDGILNTATLPVACRLEK